MFRKLGKLPKKVETPKRVQTKVNKNIAKLKQIETKKVFATKNVQKEIKTHIEQNNDDFTKKLHNFVKTGEGQFQYKAFCDDYWKVQGKLIRKQPKDCGRFSIGYGTESYWGEVITFEEGVKRKAEDLKRRSKLITSTCLTDYQKIVTLDFMYQHGNNSSGIVKKANNCQITQLFYTIANWRDYYKSQGHWGMVKREQLRLNNFYK